MAPPRSEINLAGGGDSTPRRPGGKRLRLLPTRDDASGNGVINRRRAARAALANSVTILRFAGRIGEGCIRTSCRFGCKRLSRRWVVADYFSSRFWILP